MLVVVWAIASSSEQQAAAGQQASRPKGLIFTRELPKVPRKFKKIEGFLWGSPPPKGGGGWGAKPPNIFECWWLFGPWQAAVSSKQQQASRPKGLIFTRELPKVPRKFRKIEGFYGAATPQGGWWLGGQAPQHF